MLYHRCLAVLLSPALLLLLLFHTPKAFLFLDEGTRIARPTVAATWALPGEELKVGHGLLFFAYGGTEQVEWFLQEATLAAASFRKHNPTLSIGIVSNNESVDRSIFTHHVVPRQDLLFAGSSCPDTCRHDKLPRQWTTRLYYMALSPFAITLAFDSNVYHCPGPFAVEAVHRFLRAADRTDLWGYDIAHANGHRGVGRDKMAPHCFALIFRWNERTSAVFRDWFMLMLRRGIATNDQEPLRVAEARQSAVQRGQHQLRVGQVPSEYAAAFYSAKPGQFYPRISRPLRGPAYVVHGTPIVSGMTRGNSGPELCRSFNAARGTRRQLLKASFHSQPETLLSGAACRAALALDECPYQGGEMSQGVYAELLPTKVVGLQHVRLDAWPNRSAVAYPL